MIQDKQQDLNPKGMTPRPGIAWPALAASIAAACGPALLAYNVSPSPTFLNQALALALWGGFVLVVAQCSRPAQALQAAARDTALPLLALGLLLLSVLMSWGPGSLPSGLALSAIALLLATVLLLLSGADPALVDRALALAMAGGIAVGQSDENCFDPAASNALVARGGEAISLAKLPLKLLARWPA